MGKESYPGFLSQANIGSPEFNIEQEKIHYLCEDEIKKIHPWDHSLVSWDMPNSDFPDRLFNPTLILMRDSYNHDAPSKDTSQTVQMSRMLQFRVIIVGFVSFSIGFNIDSSCLAYGPAHNIWALTAYEQTYHLTLSFMNIHAKLHPLWIII